MNSRLINYLLLTLLFAGCGKQEPEPGTDPTAPEGEVTLRLTPQASDPNLRFDWGDNPRALVNGIARPVALATDGTLLVGTDASTDGGYTIHFPAEAYSRVKSAFILPPAQFPTANGAIRATSCPMYGAAQVATNSGEVKLTPLCGVLQITLSGSARIQSILVEDRAKKAVTGAFPFNASSPKLTQNSDPQNFAQAVIDCSASGEGIPLTSSGIRFGVAIPEGSYPSGFRIRITDRDHRAMSFEVPGPCAITAGAVKSLPVKAYIPEQTLLFAEYFDSFVWGCDYATEQGGYGVGAGSSSPTPATASGAEVAYVAKNPGTPGTVVFETTDYMAPPAESTTLAVRRDYLRNRNLYDWQRLFYAAEYRGYLGAGDPANYNNRGILITPLLSNATRPGSAELTFRIFLERGMTSPVACLAEVGVLCGASIDGSPVDIEVQTSTNISQNIQGLTRTALLLRPEQLAPGAWHHVKLSFGAIAASSAFRFIPSVIRGSKNCFWIDDLEVHRTAEYPHADDCIAVEPTMARATAGEEIARLRLQPSTEFSMGDEAAYAAAPSLGMTWLSPALPSDESLWERAIANGVKYLSKSGTKVWCIHLPYGARTATRNRDLCASGAERAAAIAYFTKAIRAVAPLNPTNVLIHCNQTLAFDDGSSAESLALSLHELQTIADEQNAHVCVENMSYGVGADAAVLGQAVDEANAMGNHTCDVRIGMDTGHANLYVTRTQPGKSVVDWLRTAGDRIGHLHIHGNRGWRGSITDDHLMPGYAGLLQIPDAIGAAGLWGAFYHTLLADCRYRGPFTYEVGNKSFDTVNGEERYDNISSPWHVLHNYNTYIYPAFRAYNP